MTLRVLGKTEAHSFPIAHLYEVEYSGGSKLDSVSKRLNLIIPYLDSLSIRYEIHDQKSQSSEHNPGSAIQIITYATEDLDRLVSKAEQIGLDGKKKYQYHEHDFLAEDQLAVEAYKDARNRAEKLAFLLGKKIKGVRYIDDHVDRVWFYVNEFPALRCRTSWANELLDLIDIMFSYNPGEEPGERLSQYAIWVGFDLME